MTDQEAIDILSAATEPQTAGKITRKGYVQIQQALEHLAKRLSEIASDQPKE